MEYAYRIAKTEGLEALAARCRRNAETFIPSQIDDSQAKEFVQRAKEACVFTILTEMIYVLHVKFGYGEKRLSKVMSEFIELSDSVYYKWLTFADIATCIKDETGIDLTPYMPMAYKVEMELDKKVMANEGNYQPGTNPDENHERRCG